MLEPEKLGICSNFCYYCGKRELSCHRYEDMTNVVHKKIAMLEKRIVIMIEQRKLLHVSKN